jgi:hypothetical protein
MQWITAMAASAAVVSLRAWACIYEVPNLVICEAVSRDRWFHEVIIVISNYDAGELATVCNHRVLRTSWQPETLRA